MLKLKASLLITALCTGSLLLAQGPPAGGQQGGGQGYGQGNGPSGGQGNGQGGPGGQGMGQGVGRGMGQGNPGGPQGRGPQGPPQRPMKWWKDSAVVQKLGLNDAQVKQIEDTFQAHKMKLIDI